MTDSPQKEPRSRGVQVLIFSIAGLGFLILLSGVGFWIGYPIYVESWARDATADVDLVTPKSEKHSDALLALHGASKEMSDT